ncbi:MAG: hypothetical protein ACPGVN_03665 [Alphaproteobacteria bacterium]
MNPLSHIDDFLLGLIVEVDLDCLPDLINHPNFACGLVRQDDPQAPAILKALEEADIASMSLVTNANKLDLPVDGILVDPVGFSMLDLSSDDRPDCEVAVLCPSASSARHQAMEAAERGADLLVFDASTQSENEDGELNTGVHDANWWLEVMELPCALDLRGSQKLPTLNDAPADFWLVHHSQIVSHDLIRL